MRIGRHRDGAAESAPPAGGVSAPPAVTPVAGGAGTTSNLVSQWFDERGTTFAFVFIFLMGLALNLTPCVYPMMGVTVSLFGASAASSGLDRDRRHEQEERSTTRHRV